MVQEQENYAPDSLTSRDTVTAQDFIEAETQSHEIRGRMIALQEESDWACYRHYALNSATDNLEWPEDKLTELPVLTLGERAFEIAMAREVEAGQLETTWFTRHSTAGSQPISELPAHWPPAYRDLVERRLAILEENKDINLIERPEYKRRWNTEPWADRQEEALRQWLLSRLEGYFLGGKRVCPLADGFRPNSFPAQSKPALVSLQELADAVAADQLFLQTAALYLGQDGFDSLKLLEDLCLPESVPYLPVQRYKLTGLRKREDWEETWGKQRHEDAAEARVREENPDLNAESLKELIRETQLSEVGSLTVPPKYGKKDFCKDDYWKMRGKLDVPKERWISYPGLERETSGDRSTLIAWAGWDHAQQAQGPRRSLQRPSTKLRLATPPPRPRPRRPRRTPPLAPPMARRTRPRHRRQPSRLLPNLPRRRSPHPRLHHGPNRVISLPRSARLHGQPCLNWLATYS